jgi:hypothetical protein
MFAAAHSRYEAHVIDPSRSFLFESMPAKPALVELAQFFDGIGRGFFAVRASLVCFFHRLMNHLRPNRVHRREF